MWDMEIIAISPTCFTKMLAAPQLNIDKITSKTELLIKKMSSFSNKMSRKSNRIDQIFDSSKLTALI